MSACRRPAAKALGSSVGTSKTAGGTIPDFADTSCTRRVRASSAGRPPISFATREPPMNATSAKSAAAGAAMEAATSAAADAPAKLETKRPAPAVTPASPR
eukprot:924757-Prymnesium_polylepis.1